MRCHDVEWGGLGWVEWCAEGGVGKGCSPIHFTKRMM